MEGGRIKNYICKIPTIEEVSRKYDYEINNAENDKENWTTWKEETINRIKNNSMITYHGVLNEKIICECSAAIDPSIVQNSDELVNNKTAYLFAFRTIDEYQGKGYFSILYKFMENDLKSRGYEVLTLGVEPEEIKNKLIYQKYGYTDYIKNGIEEYPDGTKIEVEYYKKILK